MIAKLIALFTRIRTAHQLRRLQPYAPAFRNAPPRNLQRVIFAITANQLDAHARDLVLHAFQRAAADHGDHPGCWHHAEHEAIQLAAALSQQSGRGKVVALRSKRPQPIPQAPRPTPPWAA